MSRDQFLDHLLRLAVLALGAAVLLRVALGGQWFSIYGLAVVALLTLPLVVRLLRLRLPSAGLSRRRAWLYALPVGLLAALQVLYWVGFFSGSANLAVILGSVRNMAMTGLGGLLPLASAAILLLAATPLVAAGRARDVSVEGAAPTLR